jgi:sortase A
MYFMNRSHLLVYGMLLSMTLLIAGCGGEASAAEKEAAAPVVAPVAAAPVAQAAPVVMPAAAAGLRPELPRKAPVFHNSDAMRILPSRLVIPAIKVDTPVVELGWKTSKTTSGSIFSEWDVAQYAAGWHKNSSVPGEGGNVVMSGHNNILGSVFRELDQLKRGDEVELYAGGTEYMYVVDEVLIVPEKNASEKQRKANVKYIQETPDDRLTLVSCWPRDDNTHRIVVIAKPVQLSTDSGGGPNGN